MKLEKSWKTLVIVGSILLLNGLTLLSITLMLKSNIIFSSAIGCLGSGLPLLVIGLIRNKKISEKIC